MPGQLKTLIIVLLIVLLTSTVGGFFIYKDQPAVDVKIEPKPVIKKVPSVEEAATSEDSGLQYIASEIERVAQESAELAAKAQKFFQSSQVKGVYINEFLANSQTPFAKTYRQNLKKILQETELNSVVIDIKENNGLNLSDSLKTFIDELHQKNIWVIARICVFRDSSLREKNPEWYLKEPAATSSDNIWQDAAGASWLDASSTEAQAYIIDFSKKAIDFGFDELQFDYIRYPDDYDEVSGREKITVIGDFFFQLSQSLREYKPSVILSVDLFGYLATQYQSFDIGQRLSDAGKYFDYLSFMLYPSHFYGGFSADYDAKREMPSLNLPYKDEATTSTVNLVSNNPYPVILRSVLSSLDYLSVYGLGAKVRPWLQDFNLSYDVARGIIYDAEKIKAQIQGAEDGGASGWLLWNSANIYTESALKKTGE